MTGAQSRRGRSREADLVRVLEQTGWVAVRAASGPVDVVALSGENAKHPAFGFEAGRETLWRPMLIQVKSTAGGPFERFQPSRRRQLVLAAEEAHAEAWLVWWPPGRSMKWIASTDWPKRKSDCTQDVPRRSG